MDEEKTRLDASQDNPDEVVEEPKQEELAPSEEAQEEEKKELPEDILRLIEEAKAAAIREAEERAFRRAQSKIDQDVARTRKAVESQLKSLQQYYEALLAEHLEPEELEAVRRQTREVSERATLMQELEELRAYRAQMEAERQREEYIKSVCKEFGVNRYDPRLDESSPEAFLSSVARIVREDLAKATTAKKRAEKREQLTRLKEAGALDVVGGTQGMAAAPFDWATLRPFSDESIIAEELLRKLEKVKPDELGRLIEKTKQYMKKHKLPAKEAAQRIAMMELGRI